MTDYHGSTFAYTDYDYDDRNRLTSIEYDDGSTLYDAFGYALDTGGNITKTTYENERAPGGIT